MLIANKEEPTHGYQSYTVRYRSKNWINGLINVIGCDTDSVNEKSDGFGALSETAN